LHAATAAARPGAIDAPPLAELAWVDVVEALDELDVVEPLAVLDAAPVVAAAGALDELGGVLELVLLLLPQPASNAPLATAIAASGHSFWIMCADSSRVPPTCQSRIGLDLVPPDRVRWHGAAIAGE
jgi:hypothetical protein